METSHRRAQLIAIGIVVALVLVVAGGIVFWLVTSDFSDTGKSPTMAAIATTAPSQVIEGIAIGGVVQNQDGHPITGVRVALSWRQSGKPITGKAARSVTKTGRALTGEGGQWVFSGIPQESLDTLELNFSSSDYVPLGVYAPPADHLRDKSAVFVLANGFKITGQVVDSYNHPIAGATVTARRWEDDTENPTARSGTDGRFILSKLRGGRQNIMAMGRGFAPDVQNVLSQAGAAPLKFQLGPGQTLRGRVVDPSGKPVSEVAVRVEFWHSTQMLKWNANTDAQGRFEMRNAPSGVINFMLDKQGYENPRKELTAGPDEQVITMAPLPIFSGTVIDADTQKPITKFRALPGALWPGWASPIFSFRNAEPFKDGAYTLKASGFGGEVVRWYVRVEADGYVPAIGPAPHGGPVIINIALHHCPDITGRLIDASGKPIAYAQVDLFVRGSSVNIEGGRMSSGHDEAAQSVKTDSLGKFRFNPQLGPFELWSVTDVGCAEMRGDASTASNLEMTFQPWARFRVRGIPKSGPVSDLYLRAHYADDPAQRMNITNWYYALNAATNGEAVFDRLPATYAEGLAALEFSMKTNNGIISRSFVAHLTPGKESVLDLNEGTDVTGRVTHSSDDSSRDFNSAIMLYRVPTGHAAQSPSDWLAAAKALPGSVTCSAQVGPDGQFNLPGVTPGVYQYSFESYQEPEEGGSGTVVVPAVAARETFQMPDVVGTVVQLLKIGDPAPVELGRTLEEKPIHPSDFAGKYIIWIVWDDMGTDHEADWSKLCSDIGDDKGVAFVADNVDPICAGNFGAPWRRPPTISQRGWTNGYLSIIDMPLFQSLAYYKQNREVICLIDPTGKIRAMDLAPEQVKESLDQLKKAAGK